MANPEHLAILKQGVEAWNEWREGNPDATIDLREAMLHGAEPLPPTPANEWGRGGCPRESLSWLWIRVERRCRALSAAGPEMALPTT